MIRRPPRSPLLPYTTLSRSVKQVQVNVKAGLTFASGLRSMVRSDPDVIMVGEGRHREPATLATESALTGHLVLTTLHTNDAPLAAARLIEMGIEPFLVAGGVQCVVAQRLVRALCECKRPVELSKAQLVECGLEGAQGFSAHEPEGCVRCGTSGYRGRHGIYEVMAVDERLRTLILERASAGGARAGGRGAWRRRGGGGGLAGRGRTRPRGRAAGAGGGAPARGEGMRALGEAALDK